jgi:SAM-dependent methyltransferase
MMRGTVLKAAARKALKSSFGAASLYYVVSDARTRLTFTAGRIESEGGTPHQGRSVDESIAYIRTVFSDYKRYGAIAAFHGKVAEVGPGDNCGVGLLCLADGCTKADLVDRFYSKRSAVEQSHIYRALLDRHPELRASLRDANLENEETFKGIERWYGSRAAAEEFFERHAGYDFILSRAVFEHLYDPLSALRRMANALNSGGALLHKIDLRDHGMFSERFHELKFLEVPDWLYPSMTAASGRPNRVLVHRYRALLNELGLDYQLLVTRLVGVGDIDPHVSYSQIPLSVREASIRHVTRYRHRFAASFGHVAAEDLSVSGVFLVARKS